MKNNLFNKSSSMQKRIENMSNEINKAVSNGLFNNLWLYLKDFNNYKLQLIIEDKNEGDDQFNRTIIGEFNSLGFKDFNGSYIPLEFDSCLGVPGTDRTTPQKYKAVLVGETSWYDDNETNKNEENEPSYSEDEISISIVRGGIFTARSFELLPFKFHIEQNEFKVNLPIELMFKVEEALTFELMNNIPLKEFLFKSLFTISMSKFEFESTFNFVSYIKDDNGNPYLNDFFSIGTFDFYSKIKPVYYDILEEANRLTATSRISPIVKNLPQTFFDDLLEIEEKEQKKIGLGLVFREYHRLIERLGNNIYENLYDQIQNIAKYIPAELQYEFDIKQILYRQNLYRITSLNRLSKLLKLISSKYSTIIGTSLKKEIIEKYIPVIETFSGFSALRNIQTHDKIPVEDDILRAGINACKKVIINIYNLFNERLGNQN